VIITTTSQIDNIFEWLVIKNYRVVGIASARTSVLQRLQVILQYHKLRTYYSVHSTTKTTCMKKLFLASGSCIIIFSFIAFKLNDHPDSLLITTYARQNIISCSPANNSYKKVSFKQRFIAETGSLEEIATNDNRKPAGEMKNGILYLKLETRTGAWYPETHDGEALPVYAFAETGKPLQLPGPLIRVPEGTIINAEIHNTIPGSPLVLHGFYSRPGNAKDSVIIPYGKTYKAQFKTGKAGTYFYWASDGNIKERYTGLPFFTDSQLYGAFIVDPKDTKPDPEERIMMIGIWNDTSKGEITYEREELALNGLKWPYTERLTYKKDRPVHWRLINTSNQEHPMHLHGFYFKVNSRGNADGDNIYKETDRYLSVTELLKPHETISMTWIPEREGNWLFHCHTLFHIMGGSFLRKEPVMTEEQMNDIATHAANSMGGLIMGITVLPPKKETARAADKIIERQLTLIVEEKKNYYDTITGKGFVLREGNTSTNINASIPGPPIILERGKSVAIKIINHLHEATTIHWHGLEIESYFDGVAGWGNRSKELAPLIMAGDSFIVHITPPRAGTFIYHTHMHSMQLFEGMYGALIVTEPGEKYNNATNKIFLLGQYVDATKDVLFLNGKAGTDSVTLKKGMNYRFRIINITGVATYLTVSVLLNGVPVNWRPVAKDGADLPVHLQRLKSASDQSVSVGQTFDFEFNPTKSGNYFFAVKDYKGAIVVGNLIQVK
jgi:FtsP/CotA-like multicopper oxidase with cupredoxin domain